MSRRRASPLGNRVRHAVLQHARQLVWRLESRADQQVRLFSRLRDREVLLSVLPWPFASATFSEWATLEPKEQLVVGHFGEAVEALRWYATYTEDMPSQVALQLTAHRQRLREALVKLEAVVMPPVAQLPRVFATRAKKR